MRHVDAELNAPGTESVLHQGPPSFVWRDFNAHRFSPAVDEASGVRVIISGRVSLSNEAWGSSARLPYRGGLAARFLLDRFLRFGVDGLTPFNGPAAIFVEDSRSRCLHIITDQMGYHPCFVYRNAAGNAEIITTFPDLILCDPGADASLDILSMAEFIRGWRAVPPNTYFSNVKHLGCATVTRLCLDSGETSTREYWAPFMSDPFPSMGHAAEALADAISTAANERTQVAESPVFFLSGGADSRLLLFTASDRSAITAINLYERLAEETKVARLLCESAGARFVALQRDTDFYPRLLGDIVHWSGGMWSAEDAHYLGFASEVRAIGADLVMTACTADWLFKGYGLDKKYCTFMGRNLPLFRLSSEFSKCFLPNRLQPCPPELESQLQGRLEAWFAGCPADLNSPYDWLIAEDRRVRPACYAVSVSGQIMARIFPYDTLFADSRVAECYSRNLPAWKVNGALWGKVVALLCPDAEKVVDANFGWRVNASSTSKLFTFAAGWVRRKLTRVAARKQFSATLSEDGRAPSAGSWPDMGWYARHSKSLASLWTGTPDSHKERLKLIAASDPWARPLSSFGAEGNLLMRYSTLLAHWRSIDERRLRARSTTPS